MSRLNRFLNVWRRRKLEGEFDEELRLHVDMRVERNLRQGMTPHAAHAEARRHMGSLLRAREGMNDARTVPWLESIRRDLAYAVRVLARQPRFTAVAVLTLAVGIGASTAIYSVLQAVWIDAVPFSDPHRLVVLQGQRSFDNFEALQTRNRTLAAMAPYQRRVAFIEDVAGQPRAIGAIGTTEALFTVLGTAPLAGRPLSADDLRPGAARVALLSYGFWQREFGGDAGVLGRDLPLNDGSATVVGVMPPDFTLFGFEPSIWVPVFREPDPGLTGLPPAVASSLTIDDVVARLRPGTSVETARQDLVAIVESRQGLDPGRLGEVSLVPLRDQVVGVGIGQSLFLLFAATGLVLLVACVNVANLFLGRGVERRHEIAVRGAIGAGRAGLIRQLFAENVVIAGAGAGLALAVAVVTRDALVAALPSAIPRIDEIGLDWRVLLFSIGVAGCTALLTGLVPALRASSIAPATVLAAGGSHTASTRTHRLGRLLIGAEIALAVMALAAAGLLVASFMRLTSTDPGFDPDHVVTFRLDPASALDRVPAGTMHRVADYLRETPDVVDAAIADFVPFLGGGSGMSLPSDGDSSPVLFWIRQVSPAYFSVMNLAVRAGRTFTVVDEGEPVIVVNARAGAIFWPGQDAIGQELVFGRRITARVIGVVADTHFRERGQQPEAEVYVTNRWWEPGAETGRSVVMKTSSAPLLTMQRLQADIEQMSGLRLSGITTLDAAMARSVQMQRFRAQLFGLMGLLAVLLSAVGVFSVTAHIVAQRRRELGIRMALGAHTGRTVAMVLRQTAWPALVGALLGLVGALATTHAAAQFLYQTSPTDPVILAVVVGGVVAMSLGAAWLAARKAMRIHPLEILRTD